MASSKNARCTALLLLAVLLFSCSCMGSAARSLEETAPSAPEDDYPAAPPVPEDEYPAEAPETPEQEQPPSFPEFAMPPFPNVGLPSMPEMPSIPGFNFPQPEPEADQP